MFFYFFPCCLNKCFIYCLQNKLLSRYHSILGRFCVVMNLKFCGIDSGRRCLWVFTPVCPCSVSTPFSFCVLLFLEQLLALDKRNMQKWELSLAGWLSLLLLHNLIMLLQLSALHSPVLTGTAAFSASCKIKADTVKKIILYCFISHIIY